MGIASINHKRVHVGKWIFSQSHQRITVTDRETLAVEKTVEGALEKIVAYIVGQSPRLGKALEDEISGPGSPA